MGRSAGCGARPAGGGGTAVPLALRDRDMSGRRGLGSPSPRATWHGGESLLTFVQRVGDGSRVVAVTAAVP
ncbi:hypothetical protein ABK046_17645 [Streptomyces caeruleatus]